MYELKENLLYTLEQHVEKLLISQTLETGPRAHTITNIVMLHHDTRDM